MSSVTSNKPHDIYCCLLTKFRNPPTFAAQVVQENIKTNTSLNHMSKETNDVRNQSLQPPQPP